MMLGVSSQAKSSISSPWLDEVVQDLLQSQDLVRIKKLLIYACSQTWKNNLDEIHATDLQPLLQSLLTNAPNPEQVQIVLHRVASSLNKAAEYTLVADVVIGLVTNRYPVAIPEPHTEQTNYQTVAQALHQDPEEFRIRKLLLLACKNVWVSDPYQLKRLSLAILVQELHGLAPSTEELRLILEVRVQKLSKSAEYTLIADTIFQALQPLYATQLLTESATALLDSNLESTKLLPPLVSRSTRPNEVKANTKTRSNSGASPALITKSQRDLTDLFDLRLEIIRYANPFRTKILLFSLLHEPFNQTTEHHLMLKNYQLDDLLQTLLRTYKFFTELETNLPRVAKQLDEPEEYDRVAQTVLRATKCFYSQAAIASETPNSHEATNLVQTANLVQVNNSIGESTGPSSSFIK